MRSATMGRQKGIAKTRRKHLAANAKSPGRVLKNERKIPSWLPRRSKPDPILTSSIRRFLNRCSEIIYYSDSTETLNVQVKKGTSKEAKKRLQNDLTEELKKSNRPQKFTIEEGRPFVLCSALPLDLEAVGDQLMRRKVGVYLRVCPKDGNNDEWSWHLVSVYHLVHRMCRQMEEHHLKGKPWPSPFIRSHPVDEVFRKKQDELVLSHPERKSVAVLDARKKGASEEALDDGGQAEYFYKNHYFSVDILAVPANAELEVRIKKDIGDKKLKKVNILTVPLPATEQLPPGTELLALGASNGHLPYKGKVVEATATLELDLKYSDEDTDTYLYERLLSYHFDRWGTYHNGTCKDDCGTPIFTTDGAETALLAFHIARRNRSGMGFYAFHSINAAFPPDKWIVEAYAPSCVISSSIDRESGFISADSANVLNS